MALYFHDIPKIIATKYAITKRLGKGSYGTVYNGIDKRTQKRFAIKRVESVFATTTDARRSLREISIMRLCKHPNIVKLIDVYAVPDTRTFSNLWVVMDYGGYDLGKFIKLSPTLKGWSEHHVRFISWQILAALNYLHSANIAHRDLKPTNILVTQDNHVSLIDFGLARQLRPLDAAVPAVDQPQPAGTLKSLAPPKPAVLSRQLTQHVVTRWYRPPELILLQAQYTAAVDVWSFGCIFGELLQSLDNTRAYGPLFPGRTSYPLSRDRASRKLNLSTELAKEGHQLTQIFKVIGTPTLKECEQITDPDIRKALMTRKALPRTDFNKKFFRAPAPAVQIIDGMLRFDPAKRVRVSQLLVHPYFKEVVYPKRMYKAKEMAFPFEDAARAKTIDGEKLRLRRLIVKEVAIIRKEALATKQM